MEELYRERSSTLDYLVICTNELNRLISSMVPIMSQLHKFAFALYTSPIIQTVLSNLKSITLSYSYCNHPDPTHDPFHALPFFAKARIRADAKLTLVPPKAARSVILRYPLSLAFCRPSAHICCDPLIANWFPLFLFICSHSL